jgi:hypothetical protein
MKLESVSCTHGCPMLRLIGQGLDPVLVTVQPLRTAAMHVHRPLNLPMCGLHGTSARAPQGIEACPLSICPPACSSVSGQSAPLVLMDEAGTVPVVNPACPPYGTSARYTVSAQGGCGRSSVKVTVSQLVLREETVRLVQEISTRAVARARMLNESFVPPTCTCSCV